MAERKWLVAGCLLVCGISTAAAQEASHDGRRWYDIEVSIFTNDVPGGSRSEFPVARKLSAAFLPRLRELTDRTSALMIEFPGDLVPALLPATQVATAQAGAGQVEPGQLSGEPIENAEPSVVMGPIWSPAVRESFKLPDFERDPFVDLGTRAAQFTAMNRTIDGAPDHRLLWHKVWHQPLEARAQTPAVFVVGGDRRAEHYELEGSLRVVANGTGAMLDINVWLNEFRAGNAMPAPAEPLQQTEAEWKIPALPFPAVTNASPAQPQMQVQQPAQSQTPFQAPLPVQPGIEAPASSWELTAVWQLAQTRELTANQLYYLDHPAIGVLIQVRPYVLPPLLPVDGAEDF
ncbi:MAG: CsiV family protein [Gammaproteobacteria bacterium]